MNRLITTLFTAVLFFSLSHALLALNPSRTYKQLPEKYGMEYEAHKVKTNDGKAELNIWSFPAQNKSTELILLVHNGEGNMGDFLRRVDFLRATSRVVIFDYRGFGESSEFEIDKNMYIYPHFTDDVETMIDWCRKQYTSSFSLYGWGIGGGLSLGIGWNRPEILKIIADTPFLSLEDTEERFAAWDEPMEVPFAGYDKRFEPIYTVDNAPGKQLKAVKLIVGSNDVLFKAEDMKSLVSKNKVTQKIIDKQVYVVENPDRKDNFRVNKEAYIKVCTAFLSK